MATILTSYSTGLPATTELLHWKVSYIGSKKNNWKAAKIKDDEAKLRKLKADHFLKGKYGNIKRYVMIAGKENHLKECCRKYFNRANKLLDRPPQTGEGRICIYRSSIKFKAGDYDEGRYSTCWCVMVLSVSNRRTTT